jgi:hypothetical protein
MTHDFNHHLTFYCTYNQLCVPQYSIRSMFKVTSDAAYFVVALVMGILSPFPCHFFANHINIFHKTEVQTVILSCSTYPNPNCTKRYNRKHKMVFCYQNCSDLLWEKISLVIEKNFWNSSEIYHTTKTLIGDWSSLLLVTTGVSFPGHTGRNRFNLFQISFPDWWSANTADAHPGVSEVSKDQKFIEDFNNTHCQVDHPPIIE